MGRKPAPAVSEEEEFFEFGRSWNWPDWYTRKRLDERQAQAGGR